MEIQFAFFAGEVEGLVFFVGDILQDILNGAVQNAAKIIQCFGGDVFRDGGRDAIGKYRVGPRATGIELEFALEAKRYTMNIVF